MPSSSSFRNRLLPRTSSKMFQRTSLLSKRWFIFILRSIIPAYPIRQPTYRSLFTSYSPSVIPSKTPRRRIPNVPMQNFTTRSILYSLVFSSHTTNRPHTQKHTTTTSISNINPATTLTHNSPKLKLS
jgi:hypothetical protein